MLNLLVRTAFAQVAFDRRQETYPQSPVESTHSLNVDLGDGVSFFALGAGSVTRDGKVEYWDVQGRLHPRQADGFRKNLVEHDRLRFVPLGKDNRFVVLDSTGIPSTSTAFPYPHLRVRRIGSVPTERGSAEASTPS